MLPFNIYHIEGDKYILNTNLGYYYASIDFDHLQKTILNKIEYPIKESDISFIYPYGDNFICNANGNLVSFKSSLLNKELGKPDLFIKKIIVNGNEVNDANIVANNLTKCNIKILLGSLYFNNSNYIYQYRIIENGVPGNWYSGLSDELNILLRPGRYFVQLRAITENNLSSDIKSIGIKINAPFYLTGLFYFILALLAILISIYIAYFLIKKRRQVFQQELNFMQLENKAINSLINPHFIFNALNNIQGLINKGSKERASDYISSVGKLIRQNIENLQFDFIDIEKELEVVKNYVLLQNLRFGNKINYTIQNHINNSEHIQIPPLLIHTFIENAIVHGFKNDMEDFEILLELNLSSDKYLLIKVIDNGVGYDNEKTYRSPLSNKISLGISFTQKRLKRLSEFYKVTFSLTISTPYPEEKRKGTEVAIVLYSKFSELFGKP